MYDILLEKVLSENFEYKLSERENFGRFGESLSLLKALNWDTWSNVNTLEFMEGERGVWEGLELRLSFSGRFLSSTM